MCVCDQLVKARSGAVGGDLRITPGPASFEVTSTVAQFASSGSLTCVVCTWLLQRFCADTDVRSVHFSCKHSNRGKVRAMLRHAVWFLKASQLFFNFLIEITADLLGFRACSCVPADAAVGGAAAAHGAQRNRGRQRAAGLVRLSHRCSLLALAASRMRCLCTVYSTELGMCTGGVWDCQAALFEVEKVSQH